MCTISQARKIILGIWVASFLLAVPNLVSQVSGTITPIVFQPVIIISIPVADPTLKYVKH
jgi:hypothetical protein